MLKLPQAGPTWRVLVVLTLLVLLGHLLFLLQVAAPLQVRLPGAESDVPLQMRLIAPPAKPVRPATQTLPGPRPRSVANTEATLQSEAAPVPAAPLAMAEPASGAASASQLDVPKDVVEQALPATAAASAPLAVASEPSPVHAVSRPAVGWPLISLGALPSSRLVSYQLTGMDKGLTYHASGELRWQHNERAYDMSLSIRAFLIGTRQWRSTGQIDATGLAPQRFSDSWRNERAAHFDREQQRVVFSSRSQSAALESGAQDQVSLYVQLAAAVTGEPERFVPGTRLQVQTATVRDAVPWLLMLEGAESLQLQGKTVTALKWVCQPRSQYDARIEFWVTPDQAWMPVRIRITQVSGSYIDLLWRGTEPLPDLPAVTNSTTRNTPS